MSANWPRRTPANERLQGCKIISHRGQYDNMRVMENSLTAFEKAEAGGVWGIELDVRLTRDQIPVVFHDADLQRLFGVEQRLEHLSYNDLQTRYNEIPSLEQVVRRFGGKLHLMIEIKQQPGIAEAHPIALLRKILAPLQPVQDYHLMTLNPQSVPLESIAPRQALVAIAYYLPHGLSRWVSTQEWGGLCAHYALMSNRRVDKHKRHGQCIGTGYAASRNCLYRELNRGIDWIFSNDAVELQGMLDAERNESPPV